MEKVSGVSDICLIFTPAYELLEDRLEAPLGILYLATWLNSNGFDAQVCDLAGLAEKDWQIPQADFYGFSTFSTTYQRTLRVRDIAERVNPKAILVAGGPHASALPEEVAKDFDFVIVNEGELALLELLQGKRNGNVIYGEAVSDLDELPYPDYSLVNVGSYNRVVAGKPSFSILSSRGCPYKCLFCNSTIMGGHKPVRFRSPANVVGEIKQLQVANGDVAFRFTDDIFGARLSWLYSFTELLKPLGITYRAFVRANQCTSREFTDLLYEAGCRHVAIGIESGSDYLLKRMQKGQTRNDGIRAIKNAKDSGLVVRIYLIVGFPGETWDTVRETVDLVEKAQPDEFVVYPLIPYPGTPLYHHPELYGLKNIDTDFTHYFQIHGNKESQFVYDLETADREELQSMKDYVVTELEKMEISWARDSRGFV